MAKVTIKSSMLLLCYDEAKRPTDGAAVYCQLSITQSFKKEPAGHIFHDKALRQAGVIVDQSEDDTDDGTSVSESMGRSSTFGSTVDFSSLEEETKWKGKGKKKEKVKRSGMDVYALLGLQNERWMATAEQIKAAYRRAALEHHPDKVQAQDEEAAKLAEDRFKAIQEAYEILTDPQKRKEYDSTDDFDDSLPSSAPTPEDFYRNFGAAFKRNAKWSVRQPVPDLGNDDADDETVHKFYDFWFKFKSWREFPHPDEEDVEQAENREHKRWIERYNNKLREKAKKDEVRRISEFVESAQRLDPRVIRMKEAQKAEKEARRAEKHAKKAAELEAIRKQQEEEEARKIAEEAAAVEARKLRQIEKKALQKERSRLRKICLNEDGSCNIPSYTADDIELLCANLDILALGSLSQELSESATTPEDKSKAVSDRIFAVNGEIHQERLKKEQAARELAEAAKLAAKKETKERVAKLQDWSEEEIRLLQKALDKFPPGTSRRWETVQAYLRTRSVEEILDMVKHGLKGGKFTTNDAEGVTIAPKRQANTVIKSEATSRIESFSDVEVQLRGPAAAVLGEKQAAVPAATNGTTTTAAASASNDEWSEKEDLALVKALKTVPKDAADRWEQVAAAVGKSKVQCAKRFKEMKESYKAKKTTAA